MRLIIVNKVKSFSCVSKSLILLLPLLLLLDYLLDCLLYLGVGWSLGLLYHQWLFTKETLKSLSLSLLLSLEFSQVSISRLNFLFCFIDKLFELILQFFPLWGGCVEFFVNTVSFLPCHNWHLTSILVIHRFVCAIIIIFFYECVDPKYPIGLGPLLALRKNDTWALFLFLLGGVDAGQSSLHGDRCLNVIFFGTFAAIAQWIILVTSNPSKESLLEIFDYLLLMNFTWRYSLTFDNRLFLWKRWNPHNRLHDSGLLNWLFRLKVIFLNHIILEDKLMHYITRSIINSMYVFVFKGT